MYFSHKTFAVCHIANGNDGIVEPLLEGRVFASDAAKSRWFRSLFIGVHEENIIFSAANLANNLEKTMAFDVFSLILRPLSIMPYSFILSSCF